MSRMGIMGSLRSSPLSRLSFACVTRCFLSLISLIQRKRDLRQCTGRGSLQPINNDRLSHASRHLAKAQDLAFFEAQLAAIDSQTPKNKRESGNLKGEGRL